MKYQNKAYLLITQLAVGMMLSGAALAQTDGQKKTADAETLWQEFQNNQQQAQQAFSGETLTISGVVSGTTTSVYGTPNVLISDANNKAVNIICVMPRTQFGQLSTFVSGQPVTMSGKFYSANSVELIFKGCKRERV